MTTHEELDHNTTNTAAVELLLGARATCLANKQRVVKSHRLWRTRACYKPRTHCSMDVKRVGPAVWRICVGKLCRTQVTCQILAG